MMFFQTSEESISALMQAMPRCLMSAANLRNAIDMALTEWAIDTIDKAWATSQSVEPGVYDKGTDADRRRHAERIAGTARKLNDLLRETKANVLDLVDGERARFIRAQFRFSLIHLIELADDAVASSRRVDGDPYSRLILELRDIYERATGEPPRGLITDRSTGEISGPLLDFIRVAAAPALSKHPLSDNAIKKRLLTLSRKARRTEKAAPTGPVTSDSGPTTSATKPNSLVAHLEAPKARKTASRSPLGRNRRGT